MAGLIARSLTASGTEASVTFNSKMTEIALLANDSTTATLSIAFGESVTTADEVIVLKPEEELTNITVGSVSTMYYKSTASNAFRLIGVSD